MTLDTKMLITLGELKEDRTEAVTLKNTLHNIHDVTIDRAMKTVVKRLDRLIEAANERKHKSLSTDEIEAGVYDPDA